ncbi:hypothetical protein FB45DRAFT_873962 [Roridomyces roridus]|uniref:N-acetyltransferase domain-containing protein n=1 Tax=Roridomyces roridus TaxID=1738132 RepID=A0AAD7B943_9AGAR|nr:hypothetical protein FB45DRAFT_873962 [Roridomyces roridus]
MSKGIPSDATLHILLALAQFWSSLEQLRLPLDATTVPEWESFKLEDKRPQQVSLSRLGGLSDSPIGDPFAVALFLSSAVYAVANCRSVAPSVTQGPGRGEILGAASWWPLPNPIVNAQRHLVRQRAAVQALFAGYASGKWKPAPSSPFDVVREIKEDGSEAYVGQVTFGVDEHTKRTTPVPEGLEEWRIEVVCEIGAVLNLEYHNRGIASAAVRTILHDWAVPQMGATEIHAGCFQSNISSAHRSSCGRNTGLSKFPS